MKDSEQYSQEIFDNAKSKITPLLLSKYATKIEREITNIVEALDGRRDNNGVTQDFSEWSIEALLSAQGRLALLRVNLGILASEAQAQTNFSMRYKVYQMSKKWNPTKVALQKEFDRLGMKFVKSDVENTLIEALWETTQKEIFLQEISDRLISLHSSTQQVLTALRYKINYLVSEQNDMRRKDDNV